MRLFLGGALLLALVLPAGARASTISTDASNVNFNGGATDQVFMGINIGFDNEFASSAIYFVPISNTPPHVNPTTTDPNCRAASGEYKCAAATDKTVNVTAGSQNDFVRILGAGSHVVFHAGAGNDRAFPDGGTRLTAFGEAGNDQFSGNAGLDTFDGGPGDDSLTPFSFGDVIIGGPDFDTANVSGVVTLDNLANDGTAGQNQNIRDDVEKLVGGTGNDDLTGSAGANELNGSAGNDTLTGLGGVDTLNGGDGDDVIQARDGLADVVSCGPGTNDRAVLDPADQVAGDCEVLQYADSDGDGFDARSDCNDANPAIHPGATDIPGNGVDEDCVGGDAGFPDADNDGFNSTQDCDDSNSAIHPGANDVPANGIDEDCSGGDASFPDADKDGFDTRQDCNDGNPGVHPGATDVPGNGVDEDCSGTDAAVPPATDADRDGTSPPVDCNDNNAAIHPGAADVPADGIDQDCSGADAPRPVVQAPVTHRWSLGATSSRVVQLTVKAPSGATITVRCRGRGCAFKTRTVKASGAATQLAKLFKKRQLRKGTVIEVEVSVPGFVARVVRFTVIGRRKIPRSQQLCRQPGATSVQACG